MLYNITPTTGVFRFAISPKASKGFLGIGGNPKMRWVINYSDPKNYIEFQIDKQILLVRRVPQWQEDRTRQAEDLMAWRRPAFEIQMTVAPEENLD